MSSELHFNPHIRALWCNKVDVSLEEAGQSIGPFTTYGKIMAFVMRFFGVDLEKIDLNGRIHFVRPKELERFKQTITQDNALLFDKAIKQVKTVDHTDKSSGKISILSLCPSRMLVDHDTLEQGVLGDEFQPVRDGTAICPGGVYFMPYTTRPMVEEIEHCLDEAHLGNIPTAVVFNQIHRDSTRGAAPQNPFSGLELLKNNHRVFHIITQNEGLNDCTWNENQIANIRQFLKDSVKATA